MFHSAFPQQDLGSALALLHARSRAEPYPPATLRRDRLDRVIALLAEHRHAICQAIRADYGARSNTQSLIAEIFVTQQALAHSKRKVARWMRPEKRSTRFLGLPLALLGARAEVQHQPLGVVGVIGPWNFPVNLLLAPLAGIFAAGNVAMLKPSEHSPKTASLLAHLVQERFDPDELTVVTGALKVAQAFSELPFDHLIYTGGGTAARHILRAAAENLTPVTLELGGKSPVIVSDSAWPASAARRIIGGKLLNNGQVCLAPDVVMVPRAKMDAFAEAMACEAAAMVPNAGKNPDVAAVVNAAHFNRISALLGDAQKGGARVLAPKTAPDSETGRRMPITLVLDPADDSRIMQEEIFGPLIALRPYDDFGEVITWINARPRPLALYYFGRDRSEIHRLGRETVSGSLVLNDVIMQYTANDLPFGGVGGSGMGRYHGIDGFRTFSNARAVYRQAKPDLAALVRPPFTPAKARLFDFLSKGRFA